MLVEHNIGMSFLNRQKELLQIARQLSKGGFGYVTGRRRIGKSALLLHACMQHRGLYHQAVEGTPQQQLAHLVEEIKDALPIFREIAPKTWEEFFRLLAREKLPKLLVIDEFPYLVQGDPMLPSLLQKWIDHDLPKQKTLLMVSGSAQSMLHAQCLHPAAPLYGRALLHLHLAPLSYRWFCKALRYRIDDPRSFERFSLTGGIPHYWKLLPRGSVEAQTHQLYFEPTAILAEEPIQMIRDEGDIGVLPKAILDFVGRGVSKPSELAARLGTAHGNLSRPLALLLELGFLHRECPFGESLRTTKKVLYRLHDPVLAFYYGSFLPFRSRWTQFTRKERLEVVHRHAAAQWELFCRQQYPDAGRYWEGQVEIDLVAFHKTTERHLIAECKWARLDRRKKQAFLDDLRRRFATTALSHKLGPVEFRIFSQDDVGELAGNGGA